MFLFLSCPTINFVMLAQAVLYRGANWRYSGRIGPVPFIGSGFGHTSARFGAAIADIPWRDPE